MRLTVGELHAGDMFRTLITHREGVIVEKKGGRDGIEVLLDPIDGIGDPVTLLVQGTLIVEVER